MSELIARDEPVQIEQSKDSVEIGQWYWVENNADSEEDGRWLGCLTHIGSNYVKVTAPSDNGLGGSVRIHLNDFDKYLKLETDPNSYINKQQKYFHQEVFGLMEEVQRITSELGIVNPLSIAHQSSSPGTGLAVMSGNADVKGYEKQLIKVKEETLPELFDQIEEATKNLQTWLSAPTVPMKASIKQMQKTIDLVDDRIFNVSLYAGLTEQVIQIADGEPASIDERLHVMQRRLYMDEECLIGYEHGGMEMRHIEQFDQWLVKKENRDRLLPFNRCVVSMRVRRHEKQRESDGLLDLLINIRLAEHDKRTFMLIRNGEKIYRMECDLDFGEMIFPERGMFDPQSEKMMHREFSDLFEFMTVNEFNQIKEEIKEDEKIIKQWLKDNPYKEWKKEIDRLNAEEPLKRFGWKRSNEEHTWKSACPHSRRHHRFHEGSWVKFNDSSVYYDDAVEALNKQIKQYNRVAIIIQGLFDRSPCLHPHHPVKTWTPEGFDKAVRLVYDAENVLHHGDAPDFEQYRATLNSMIDENSVFVGQEDFWLEHEAIKECERRDRVYRSSDHRPTRYQPEGNKGPGHLAKPAKVRVKTGKATFRWTKKRSPYNHRWTSNNDPLPCTITVPFDRMMNVSAYKLGDYKMFFNDPRTRQEYLKWAGMLLIAEDYAAGKMKPQLPTDGDDE